MRYFEDFTIGERTVTRGRTITETDIVNFAALSGDWYPLHTNTEYAKSTIFKERIAHGLLVLSIATGFVQLYEMSIIAFYGMEKVRAIVPTKIGDTIHVDLEVTAKEPKEKGTGIVEFKVTVINQRGESSMVALMKLLLNTRNN
jgi:3-hydroxybutyryl-CoA dehydratase